MWAYAFGIGPDNSDVGTRNDLAEPAKRQNSVKVKVTQHT